jgi:hypothetical protein
MVNKVVINMLGFHLCPILTKLKFFRLILANPQYLRLRKSVLLEASCFKRIEYKRDGHDEANSHCCEFSNAPKKKTLR